MHCAWECEGMRMPYNPVIPGPCGGGEGGGGLQKKNASPRQRALGRDTLERRRGGGVWAGVDPPP